MLQEIIIMHFFQLVVLNWPFYLSNAIKNVLMRLGSTLETLQTRKTKKLQSCKCFEQTQKNDK